MVRDSNIDRKPIADKLVDVMDNVRRKIHRALGTRTYRVQIITRRWSSGAIGIGTPTSSVLEIDPRPLFRRSQGDRLAPAGREDSGDATISQISLRYSAADLQPDTPPGTEIAWRVIDTGGQRQPDQWYTLMSDPLSRRGDQSEDSSDWVVKLKATTAMTNFDGEN